MRVPLMEASNHALTISESKQNVVLMLHDPLTLWHSVPRRHHPAELLVSMLSRLIVHGWRVAEGCLKTDRLL